MSICLAQPSSRPFACSWLAGVADLAANSTRPQLRLARADGTGVVAVTHASTVDQEEEWYLTAHVRNEAGSWTATFSFPKLGVRAEVTFASGDWSISEITTDGTVTLDLPDEPLQTPRLSIRFAAGEQVVGYHGILLPNGEFAAG